ncbi:inositol monophosphatase [Candidatus Uhrbacteria bacterium]|nr:inositol monophosphatase [Candidatus Uhrbacteria bacterium]
MEYKQFAINLAKEAGGIMRANFMLGMKREWKEDNSPVTETDLKINQLVLDSIQKEFPDHSVLAEEGSALKAGSEYTWVCDPLDGTIPFSHGLGISVFSLALVQQGKSILGVVYDPFFDRLYYAQKNKGAFLNEKPIKVSSQQIFERGCVEFSIPRHRTNEFPSLYNNLRNTGAKTMSLLTTVHAGALVASGEFLATLYLLNHAHDVAALKILVEEAGGRVTDIDGNDQRYDRPINGAIISNGLVHDQLVDLIKKSRVSTRLRP